MKKILILVLTLTLLTSCVKSLQPVATLDELATKEELEKKRSWFKQSHARNTTGAAMGATLVLFPVAMIIAFTPNEKDLTINEIADVAAVKTYDYDSTLFLEWIAYTDGAMSIDYWIVGRGKGNKDANGIKPVGVIYWNKDKNKVYYEGWLVKKMEDSSYWHWRMPLLKKKDDGSLIYVLDETLKLKEAKMVGGFNLMNFALSKDVGDSEEITKKEDDIFKELIDYYTKNNLKMTKVKCANGSDDCVPKDKEIAAHVQEKGEGR